MNMSDTNNKSMFTFKYAYDPDNQRTVITDGKCTPNSSYFNGLFESIKNLQLGKKVHFTGTPTFSNFNIGNLSDVNSDGTTTFTFEHPIFKNCNFLGNRVTNFGRSGSSFENCNMFDSTWEDCTFSFSHTFTNCNLRSSNISLNTKKRFGHVMFEKCDLRDAKVEVTDKLNPDEKSAGYYFFKKCSLKNTDMSNCDFSEDKVDFQNCDITNTNFNGCVIGELNPHYGNPIFRWKFLMRGGKIVKDIGYTDGVASWLGKKLGYFE